VLEKIMHKIKKLNPQPEFIAHLGDMTAGSSNPEELEGLLERFKKIIGSYYTMERFYPVIGNHDVGVNSDDSSWEKIFRKVFNEFLPESQPEGYNNTAYSFSRDGEKLIVLNTK
jgi:predicted phosphodiesterase